MVRFYGPELRWDAAIALFKLGYTNETTQTMINRLLDREYLEAVEADNKINETAIDFVILKVLTIINSICESALKSDCSQEELILIKPFQDSIYKLSDFDSNLEIRDFAKKIYNKRFK